MRETKFTPGPWAVNDRNDAYLNGHLHAMWEVVKPTEPQHLGVAVCLLPQEDYTESMAETIAANARLLGASPDLYEALLNLVNGGSDSRAKDWEQAEAALAKAGRA